MVADVRFYGSRTFQISSSDCAGIRRGSIFFSANFPFGVTQFLRDPDAFDALRTTGLLLEASQSDDPLRRRTHDIGAKSDGAPLSGLPRFGCK
jgi:hypothetical protein